MNTAHTNKLAPTNSTETLSKQESGPDYLLCGVYYCREKKKKRTRSHFKTSALAFLSHIILVKIKRSHRKTQLKSGRKQAACSFYGDFKLDHSATLAGSDRAIKGHHLLYLSSAWCVCALTEVNEFMNVWRGVRENRREYTVLFTVYESCLYHLWCFV